MQTTQEIFQFYQKQIHENVAGVLKAVCDANGILLEPKAYADLAPVPVYEGLVNLHSTVDGLRCPTKLLFPQVTEPDYLQAYFKKYKDPVTHKTCNEVVVCVSNYCWARYYAAKELMHCMIDEDGYGASKSLDAVNELLEELSAQDRGFLDSARPQTIVDEIAWLGAMLYMVPDQWVPMLKQLHADLAAKAPDANAYLHLAQIIRVPEIIIKNRLRHG